MNPKKPKGKIVLLPMTADDRAALLKAATILIEANKRGTK